MIIRFFLTLLAIAGIMWYLAWYHKASPEKRNQSLRTALLYGVGIALLLLVITGRIPWLFAIFSAAVPWINRAMMAKNLWNRFKGKENVHGGETNTGGQAPPNRAISTMTPDEALEILGLETTATKEDIVAAHRKLMSRIHPDRGGSDYLAKSINQAREVLLDSDHFS